GPGTRGGAGGPGGGPRGGQAQAPPGVHRRGAHRGPLGGRGGAASPVLPPQLTPPTTHSRRGGTILPRRPRDEASGPVSHEARAASLFPVQVIDRGFVVG